MNIDSIDTIQLCCLMRQRLERAARTEYLEIPLDMLDQESLFEMQEGVCDLIADGSNQNIAIAKEFARNWDHMFITTQEPVK